MKEMIKRTAVVTLAGVMAAGMLTGCGSKTLDGTKTVATIDGTDIPLGIVSLYARQQQEQTTAMYLSFMGSADNIWDTSDDSGETYGEQAVDSSLKAVELMYLLKEKAADYNVEITDDEETAIADAASQFMSDNSEETIKELGVTEDQVKTLLELRTIQQKTHDSIVAEGNITVSDDEANQSSFTYVSISTSGDDITDDEKAEKKEQAQEILDKMKENPTADMSEVAKEVDDSYSAVQGNFTVKESDDEDSSAYPEEVLTVLRGLTEGEVASDIIETDTGYYVVRLDKVHDDDATASKRESLKNSKESTYYSDTTSDWLDSAKTDVNKKVLKTLKITDKHTFTAPTPTPTPEVTEEATTTPEAKEEATETPAAEEEVTETPEAEEEATETPAAEEEVTETPAATEAAE